MKSLKSTIWGLLLFVAVLAAQNTDEWEILGDMHTPVYGACAVWYNYAIYVFGGYAASSEAPIDLIQKYDYYHDKWSIVGHLITPRARFVADVHNDTFYLIGGVTGPLAKNATTIESWTTNGLQNTWPAQNDSLLRVGATGGIYRNKFFLFGGDGPETLSVPFGMEYNLALQAVTQVWEYNNLHPYQQAMVHNEHDFYLLGGVNNSIRGEIFHYNAFTGQTTLLTPRLHYPRAASAAVLDRTNAAYVIGGYDESSTPQNIVEKIELFNDYHIIDDFPLLNYTRQELMAVYVPDFSSEYSSIYVFGGRTHGEQFVSAVEHINIYDAIISDVQEQNITDFGLLQNYPNPFNMHTIFSFSLEAYSHVALSLYAIDGTHITDIINEPLAAGKYNRRWEAGNDISSGVYVARLVTNRGVFTRKILLVK